jgi:peroxiredoxin
MSKIDMEKLSQCLVLSPDKRPIQVSALWNKQSIIFIFLRHFACVACRAHAVQVWQNRETYEKTGSKIIFIGNGSPDFIEKFKEDLNLTNAVILTDPTLKIFDAAGFNRGFLAVVNPTSAFNMARLVLEGHKQTTLSAEGTHWQLGGVLAISKAGKVLYQFISVAVGDFPPESDIEKMSAPL